MSTKTVEMTLHYRDIKIAYDGEVIDCVDVNGNSTEPFIIDGSVYIPVRAAVNILGLDIDWDEGSNTVNLYGTVTNVDEATAYSILQKAQAYAATNVSPPQWAQELVSAAIAQNAQNGIFDNITDGSRLAQMAPRYEAAIMALRAKEQALDGLTNEQCYQILQKAQQYEASLGS